MKRQVRPASPCRGEDRFCYPGNDDCARYEWREHSTGERVISAIREELPAVVSICQNVNTRKTNVIFGDVTRVLWGREVIHDYIGDVKFAISARSFYQVNPAQTEVLYGKTVEYAGLTGKETVIDAYCGIGTISLFWPSMPRRCMGSRS